MKIPLIEPTSTRYIHINPATNRVHLLVPFIAGQEISTDNTCKSEVELNAFFEGGAVSELESWKSTLEFHISLLEEGELRQAKDACLVQVNQYLEAVISMRSSYQDIVKDFLSSPSNLYGIQLRPRTQDPYSRVVNPVFTINRGNDSWGNPLSPLYNKMQEVFPALTLGKPDPREQLTTAVVNALPEDASFEDLQKVLASQCNVPEDFFKRTEDINRREIVVDKPYIDNLMGFNEDPTPKDYISALLGVCAPNLQATVQGSPFYLGTSANPAEKAERLSILTQFYLGVLNVYCRTTNISDKNFGVILDGAPKLSQELVETVAQTLSHGDEVELALIQFCNAHRQAFHLSRDLNPQDNDAIQQKFEVTWRTVTATKENPHMDDFMLLDIDARGKKHPFITHQGLICTDFANIATTGPNQAYFAEIRKEAATHPDIIPPQSESVAIVDIELEALVHKLGDVQWERLPKEVADACRALPAFQVRQFLDDVSKGKQDEANAILRGSADIQTLLQTTGKFTDYSGRTFNCTAYEYAWWAKDTHMRRMLESHMDDETKALMLEKIEEMERSGLAYEQHGVSYRNPHYDMSFVLQNLNPSEFQQLKTWVGQSSAKIQEATVDNYQTISFTATEYEALKKRLAEQKAQSVMPSCTAHFQFLRYLAYPAFFIPSLFITSHAENLSNKLKFDFHSLITALENYVSNYEKWSYHEQDMAWLSVGKAQRDVPAHIAHEYCRPDRSFRPCPEFKEETLPRVLSIDNYVTSDKSWFPLSASSSGLGFDFSLYRGGCVRWWGAAAARARAMDHRRAARETRQEVLADLAAVRHLDEVRIADFTKSRENLERPSTWIELGT